MAMGDGEGFFGNISDWFMSIVLPAAKKLLAGLGFGFVTYSGFVSVVNNAIESARSSWAGLPGDIAVWLAIGGINVAFGIIFAAISIRLLFAAAKKLIPFT
jgi:hypothetical protein